MNDAQFNYYYEMLEQMACSIYEWQGMPPEIDQRFMELSLFNRGLSVFFYERDEYDAFFACTATPSGKVNMYSNPLGYHVYGTGGFQRYLKSTECVPIWNNYLRRPDSNAMRIYARRLADIDRTIDVNLANQKMPIMVTVSESQRLTIENLIKQWQGNEPVIVGADGIIDPSQIGYITSGAPFIVPDLLNAKLTIWNEVMTYFGIDNANISKGERVQTAEVEANNGQIEANRLVRLNCRRAACKEINRKFGLDVWCDMRKDVSSKNLENLMTIPDPNGSGNHTGTGADDVSI